MTWAKIDDRLHSHPKARAAGLEAMGLWVLAMSHCMAYLTNGRVTRAMIVALSGKRGISLAERLVESGLWERAGEDYQFHDWDEFQPSAEKIKADRRATAERVRRHRNAVGNAPRNAVTNPNTNGVGTDAPTRPVPREGDSARERATPPPSASCPSIEHSNALRGDEALDALARGSGGKFRASASATQLVELAAIARSAHPSPLTLGDFESLGRAYAAGKALAWLERPSLGVLLRNGGEHLLAGIDEARGAQIDAPAPPAVVKLVRPEAIDLAAVGDQAREALAVIRGARRG